MGFPAQYLPPSNQSIDSGENLVLPLDPSQHQDLQQTFTYSPAGAGPFKGGQLIASITSRIYKAWKAMSNEPILQPEEHRQIPFQNILHTIFPSSSRPPDVLTPLKVGIVYCWTMREALRQETWPGNIIASIYHADHGRLDLLLGWIIVRNSPQVLSGNNTFSLDVTPPVSNIDPSARFHFVTDENNGTYGKPSTIPKPTRERAWLECFVSMLFWTLKHASSAEVTASLPPLVPGMDTYILHFPSATDTRMEGKLTIAGDSGGLKWDVIVVSMQALATKAALRDEWDSKEKIDIAVMGEQVVNIRFGRM